MAKTYRSYSQQKNPSQARTDEINLTLAILATLARQPISLDNLAYLCDSSKQNMHQIEQRALRKLRNLLSEELKEWKKV